MMDVSIEIFRDMMADCRDALVRNVHSYFKSVNSKAQCVIKKLHHISATRYGPDRGITNKYPYTMLHKSSWITIMDFWGLKYSKL